MKTAKTGSPFSSQYQYEGIDFIIEENLLNLNINVCSYEFVILGNSNARTREKFDYFTFETNIPELVEYEDI